VIEATLLVGIPALVIIVLFALIIEVQRAQIRALKARAAAEGEGDGKA
jgi:hypothetical protein